MAKVVVGLDGSEGSRNALAWASAEARARSAVLEAVRVWHYPITGPEPVSDRSITEVEKAEEEAADFDIFEVLGDHEGLEMERRIVHGPTGPTLVEASEGADLLVVGSRGRSMLAGALLGSVSEYCVHHARCPVVVIPPKVAHEPE